MKIYNEVVTIFNENTGLWETISEDSYDYNGTLLSLQGLPVGAKTLQDGDKFADTTKVTTGYFTNGDGTLSGTDIFTGSLTASNEKYYFNVNHKQDDGGSKDVNSETQFSVAFGHIAGSGSDQYGDSTDNPNNIYGQTQAIYKQFTNLLLNDIDARVGFKISSGGSHAGKLSTVDKYIYILAGKRDKFKDRMNKKNWTLTLSGSDSVGNGTTLILTDDSKTTSASATPAGVRYNIVSGALGEIHTPAATRTSSIILEPLISLRTQPFDVAITFLFSFIAWPKP